MVKYAIVVYSSYYRMHDGTIPLMGCLCKSCGKEASCLVYNVRLYPETPSSEVFCDFHGRIKLLELEMGGIPLNEEP